MQLGSGQDWKKIVCWNEGWALLTKNDGTLWSWENVYNLTNSNQRLASPSQPELLGKGVKWTNAISTTRYEAIANREDGTAWLIMRGNWVPIKEWQHQILPGVISERIPAFDKLAWRSIPDLNLRAAVRNDGTLWTWERHWEGNQSTTGTALRSLRQVGVETNWVAVAGYWPSVAALKSDGSVWIWDRSDVADWSRWPNGSLSGEPERLSHYTDWLAIADGFAEGIAGLAADGKIYSLAGQARVHWPNSSSQPLLRPTRRSSVIARLGE